MVKSSLLHPVANRKFFDHSGKEPYLDRNVRGQTNFCAKKVVQADQVRKNGLMLATQCINRYLIEIAVTDQQHFFGAFCNIYQDYCNFEFVYLCICKYVRSSSRKSNCIAYWCIVILYSYLRYLNGTVWTKMNV